MLAQLLDVLQELFAGEQRIIMDIFGSRTRDRRSAGRSWTPWSAATRRSPWSGCGDLEGVQDVLIKWDPAEHPVK